MQELEMKKGYWSGQVIEIKNEEKWNRYLEKCAPIYEEGQKTGNFKMIGGGPPAEKVQGQELLFAALVEFNSLHEAIDGYNDIRYQAALKELGDNPEETVVRNLVIIEGA